jgi:hypothetical protein
MSAVQGDVLEVVKHIYHDKKWVSVKTSNNTRDSIYIPAGYDVRAGDLLGWNKDSNMACWTARDRDIVEEWIPTMWDTSPLKPQTFSSLE